jgi:hypothetical protein
LKDLLKRIFGDPINAQKLFKFTSVFEYETSGFKILLPVEKQTSTKILKEFPAHYEMNLNKTLGDNLKWKEIFEFPVFEVVLNSEIENFSIVSVEQIKEIQKEVQVEIGKVIKSLPRKFGKNKETEHHHHNQHKRKEYPNKFNPNQKYKKRE